MSKSFFSLENILSILVALVLATILFFGLRENFDSLQANVIWEQQQQLLWDVIVDTYTDRIELVANKKITDADSLSIMVFWDDELISPDFDALSSEGNITDVDDAPGRANIFVNQLWGISQDDALLVLPTSGDQTQITISDVVILFADGSSEKASVSTR